ncbi:transglutaminase/protease-like domain-containing protein [Mycoplasma sp. CAG:956]|nr:transglutaminase/protease-like domain-containing protein [Mycoplasma sp. CAG:956]
MDAINNKDTSSNRMQKYVEGNNGYISPTTSSGYLNHIDSKPVTATETMDFTDVDVDSILAEEDPFADESNKISSKPVYGKTFGTDVKFTKGYNNVYDASSESNVINLNTNIVFDGDSRIKQVKAFDANGVLVDLHIDINDDMNIDDIMQKVYESATAMGISDDKIIIDISDQNGNSRAWVRAEDILLKDKIVSKTDDNIKTEESADDVINDLPHNISNVDNVRNEVDNNQDTVSNTTNSFFSDIKNTFTKVASSLSKVAVAKMEKANKTAKVHEEMSKTANDNIKNTAAKVVGSIENAAIAKMEKANKTAKVHEEMSKTANDIIKNTIDSGMDNLKSFGNNIDKENLKINKDFNNAAEFLSSGAIAISDSFHGFIADSSKLLENANDWLANDALPALEDISSNVSNALKITGATVGTAALSLVEGVEKLGEALIDADVTIYTAMASLPTLLLDGVGSIYSNLTGNEWNSVTSAMWDRTKAFVAKKHVADWFDSFYENSAAGSWLKTNAFFFDNVREVSSGIGYTVGIIGLTIVTGGFGGIAGGTAGVAGIAGFGKGVEDAWGKGASTVGGLTSGALNGLWEGFQFFVGAKINGINVFGKSAPTIKTKLINSLIHVALDGVDGGAEGFARTLIDTCYKDGYTDENGNYVKYTDADSILKKLQENFDDLGGFNTVLTGALSGAATSALSEVLDLGKYFKDSKIHKPKLTTEQLAFIDEIEKNVKDGGGYYGYLDSYSELTSDMLLKLRDDHMLGNVTFCFKSAYAHSDGLIKMKYKDFLDATTYSGFELIPILQKVEEITSKVDMSLPTVERAKQIDKIIGGLYSYADYMLNDNNDSHFIGQSLRGITANNKLGREGLICAGYSQLYKEICERCGIKCDYVVGDACFNGKIEGRHAWNVVYDDIGNAIPVDVTWDSGKDTLKYFGKSTLFAANHIAEGDESVMNYLPDYIFEGIENIVDTMDSKYGEGKGISGLINYIITNDYNYITHTNNCRDFIKGIDSLDIRKYLAANSEKYQESFIETLKSSIYKSGKDADSILDSYIKDGVPSEFPNDYTIRSILPFIPDDVLKKYDFWA